MAYYYFIYKILLNRSKKLEESYDDMKQYLDTVLAELKRTKTVKRKVEN